MGLITPDQIVFSSVVRQPFAYVVYDKNTRKILPFVRDYCRNLGIPLVGRFSQFEYLNMDGCIRSVLDFVQT